MGSDESYFNVSLTVRDGVTRQCPQTTTSEEKGEPKQIRTEIPLLTSLTPYTTRPNRLTLVVCFPLTLYIQVDIVVRSHFACMHVLKFSY